MENNDKILFEISDLIVKALDHSISGDEFKRFQHLLRTDSLALNYYFDFLCVYASMDEVKVLSCDTSREDYGNVLLELGEYEKTALAIETAEEETPRNLIQKVVYPARVKRKISKFNIVILALNVAAIFFFILFLKFAPFKKGFEVATLSDSIGAKWADIAAPMEKGTRMVTGNEWLLLREGYVELLFDNQAKVTIEGPAEFQIVADDRIGLNYGKIYSHIPREAIGFSIYTKNCKIIDMGTDFGVYVDQNATTELQVYTGEVKCHSGLKGTPIASETIRQNSASRIDAKSGQIQNVPFKKEFFVREVDSETGTIWRGQNSIDLADIVGGGNGLGTGRLSYGVDLRDGKIIPVEKETGPSGAFGYVSSEHPFIDGVFVPDGETGDVQITSTGILFNSFPNTDGKWFVPVSNNSVIKKTVGNNMGLVELLIRGESPENPLSPRICLHPNAGITFDLEAVRNSYPGISLRHFTAQFGFIQSYLGVQADVDLYILIDGKLADSSRYLSSDMPLDVNVDIDEKDRFLSIVCLEGGENKYDWLMLVNPSLCDMTSND